MAVDSRHKRASAVSFASDFEVAAFAPDGVMRANDRAALTASYSGFYDDGSAPAAGTTTGNPMIVHVGFMMNR